MANQCFRDICWDSEFLMDLNQKRFNVSGVVSSDTSLLFMRSEFSLYTKNVTWSVEVLIYICC